MQTTNSARRKPMSDRIAVVLTTCLSVGLYTCGIILLP